MLLRRRAALFAAIAAIAASSFLSYAGGVSAAPDMGPLLPTPGEKAAPAEVEPTTVADKRAENAELIRVAERKLEADPLNNAAAAELSLYKTAETLLAQQEAVDQQISDLVARETELRKELESWTGPGAGELKAVSFVDFDRLVNRLAAEKARTELVRTKLKTAKAAFEQAQTEFDTREQERRKAHEAADAGKTGPDAAKLAKAADEAKRASALAADVAALRKKELAREKLAETVQGLTVQLLDQKKARFQPLVVFTKEELDEQLKKLATQEESIRAAIKRAEDEASRVTHEWARAKRRLKDATGDTTALAEEAEAWRRASENTRDQKNTSLDELLQIDQLRTAWNRLYKLMSGAVAPTAEELAAWKAETSSALTVLIGSTQMHLLRIEELRGELATILGKAAAAKDGPEDLRRFIDSQRGSVESMIRTHEANLVSIDASRRLHGKLRTELGRGIDLLSPRQWAHQMWSGVVWLWDYELAATVNDRSVTVGKLFRALVIFGVGWLVSRIVSRFFAHRLLKRFRLSKDAIAVIRSIIFYSAMTTAALVALRTADVPLTAFTILGGAVAIGVGFGSQTLVNNFISGLIMLAERPVRIGERVLFGGFDGVIEDVGYRCTKLRTGTDHLVTIPNSALINDSIENIGRRRTIQRTLNLLITYDTPRDSVAAAVAAIRCLLEEPGIREPIHPVVGWEKHQPKVFFNDFNAESLNLQVTYHFAPPDQGAFNEHAQKVNFRICEEFERLSVSFAFPSRTVYLANTSARDLRMRLSSEDAA